MVSLLHIIVTITGEIIPKINVILIISIDEGINEKKLHITIMNLGIKRSKTKEKIKI